MPLKKYKPSYIKQFKFQGKDFQIKNLNDGSMYEIEYSSRYPLGQDSSEIRHSYKIDVTTRETHEGKIEIAEEWKMKCEHVEFFGWRHPSTHCTHANLEQRGGVGVDDHVEIAASLVEAAHHAIESDAVLSGEISQFIEGMFNYNFSS